LPTVSLVHIVTQWSGWGGTEAYLSGQLAFFQCFDAAGWVIWPVKIVPEMTYKVSSGTLNLCSINQTRGPDTGPTADAVSLCQEDINIVVTCSNSVFEIVLKRIFLYSVYTELRLPTFALRFDI